MAIKKRETQKKSNAQPKPQRVVVEVKQTTLPPVALAAPPEAKASDAKLVVVQKQQALATAAPSSAWEAKLDLIRQTVAPSLNNTEFELFCHVARVKHLDPLQRQVHAVKRKSWVGKDAHGNDEYEERMTIQTGIDGYRAIANRTGLYMPSSRRAEFSGDGVDLECTFFVLKYSPLTKQFHEYSASALYREFVQTKKGKNEQGKWVLEPVAMWKTKPRFMLEKCAEALALRRGWPEELGGVYIDEEMQHADSTDVTTEAAAEKKQDKTQREVGKMKPSTEENRGHGEENMQRTETKTATISNATASQATTAHTHDEQTEKSSTVPSQKRMRGDREIHKDAVDGHVQFNKVSQKSTTGAKAAPYQIIDCLDSNGKVVAVFNFHQSLFKAAHDGVKKVCGVLVHQGNKGWLLDDVCEVEGVPYMNGLPYDGELAEAIADQINEPVQHPDKAADADPFKG